MPGSLYTQTGFQGFIEIADGERGHSASGRPNVFMARVIGAFDAARHELSLKTPEHSRKTAGEVFCQCAR